MISNKKTLVLVSRSHKDNTAALQGGRSNASPSRKSTPEHLFSPSQRPLTATPFNSRRTVSSKKTRHSKKPYKPSPISQPGEDNNPLP